ncbi:MAG: hypothetical protein V3R86_08185 [Candidatus Hydrothermarchaeaceae archaeon]
METKVLVGPERCTKYLAPIADKRVKFLSSPTAQDLFTAGIVSQSASRRDIKR